MDLRTAYCSVLASIAMQLYGLVAIQFMLWRAAAGAQYHVGVAQRLSFSYWLHAAMHALAMYINSLIICMHVQWHKIKLIYLFFLCNDAVLKSICIAIQLASLQQTCRLQLMINWQLAIARHRQLGPCSITYFGVGSILFFATQNEYANAWHSYWYQLRFPRYVATDTYV